MKTRKKTPPRSPMVDCGEAAKGKRRGIDGVRIAMFTVNTPRMVSLHEWPSDVDVAGAFVKLAPHVRREDRDSVDLAGAATELRERGALAVMVAPVVTVAMGKRERVGKRVVIDSRTRVRTWLERNAALSDADRDSVLAYLDCPLSEEGL
jgi:hypothetical protein